MGCSSCSSHRRQREVAQRHRQDCNLLRSYFLTLYELQRQHCRRSATLSPLSQLSLSLPATNYHVEVEAERPHVLAMVAVPDDAQYLYNAIFFMVYTYNPNRLPLPSVQKVFSFFDARQERNRTLLRSILPEEPARSIIRYPLPVRNNCY